MKPTVNIGLIGTGFMGQAHAFGYTIANSAFDLPVRANLHTVADINTAAAQHAAQQFGFAQHCSDWQTLVANPEIDIVSITAPNSLHKPMSLAAIAANKHVYCEKPLATTVSDARVMAAAVSDAGLKSQVGFNYLCNPIIMLARDMIAAGELGDIRSYRGIHAEDYMADASAEFTFRHEPEGGGALADLGSHALATAEFLLGPITEVLGDCVTHIAQRPDGDRNRTVEVDDVSRACLRFASGATGSIEANWIATGQKMQHDFEVYGSKGALVFSQNRLNELQYYSGRDATGRNGFRLIVAGPEHTPYGRFCVAPGHQLGFNDLKAIEVAGYLKSIVDNEPEPYGFSSALRIQEIIEHIQTSSRSGGWTQTA